MLFHLDLKRYIKEDNYTIGNLTLSNVLENTMTVLFDDIKTLELPYIDNKPNISCIPCGNYIAQQYNSKQHGNCIKVYEIADKNTAINLFSKFTIEEKEQWLNNNQTTQKQLKEVSNRSGILFHKGNSTRDFVDRHDNHWHQDTHGCILVGMKAEQITDKKNNNQGLIYQSKIAFDKLMHYFNKTGIALLSIRDK